MRELLEELLLRPWSSPWYIGNTLDSMALLVIAGLGIIIAFRAGAFNLGGESQIYAGGVAASAVLLSAGSHSPLLVSGMALCAALAIGALLGGTTGILKKKTGADPMITSFLLAAVISPLADWLIAGPLRDNSTDLLASTRIPAHFLLPRLLPPSSLNPGFVVSLLLVIIAHIGLSKSLKGLQLRVARDSTRFARYAGIAEEPLLARSLALGGALHGLCGYLVVAGTAGICHLGFPAGLGWNAIAVALIAANRPLALIPAALFFAWLDAGTQAAILTRGIGLNSRSFLVAAIFLVVTMRRRRSL